MSKAKAGRKTTDVFGLVAPASKPVFGITPAWKPVPQEKSHSDPNTAARFLPRSCPGGGTPEGIETGLVGRNGIGDEMHASRW